MAAMLRSVLIIIHACELLYATSHADQEKYKDHDLANGCFALNCYS